MAKDKTQSVLNDQRVNIPRPTPQVGARVEALLREQLGELGEDVSSLTPNDIAKHMKCHVTPDNSMSYFWKNHSILDVIPEMNENSIQWRMFTKDDTYGETEKENMTLLGEVDENY